MQLANNKRIASTSASRRDNQPLNEEDDLLFGASEELEMGNNRVKQQLKLQQSLRQGFSRNRLRKAKHISKKNESALDIFDESKSQLSLVSLCRSRHRDEQRVTKNNSRLHLLETEMERMKRKADIARYKYNVLMERRSTNLQMKSTVKTHLKRIERENRQYASAMRNQSMAERMHRRTSIEQWKEVHREQAVPVRLMRRNNDIKIHTMNEQMIRQNQSRASMEKSRQMSLRLKMRNIEEKKKEQAKFNHFGRVVEEFNRRKEVLRHNDELIGKLNQASNRIKKVGLRANQDIQRLEQCLALSKRTRQNRTERSFFQTQKFA